MKTLTKTRPETNKLMNNSPSPSKKKGKKRKEKKRKKLTQKMDDQVHVKRLGMVQDAK